MAASAQQEAASRQAGQVEVTGSNIPRIEGESGLPVQVDHPRGDDQRWHADDAGVARADQRQSVLRRVQRGKRRGKHVGRVHCGVAARARQPADARTNEWATSSALRALGRPERRPFWHSRVPIERVEVLKDGASAVYGTDAIGGVINFILRKDYQGAEINGTTTPPTKVAATTARQRHCGLGRPREGQVQLLRFGRLFQAGSAEGVAAREYEDRAPSRSGSGQDPKGPRFPANIAQTDLYTGETYGFIGARNPTITFPGGPTATSCAPPYSFPNRRRRQTRSTYAASITPA